MTTTTHLSNTTEETTMTHVTNESPVTNLTGINKSAIISTMGAELFHKGLNVRVAMITATAFVGAIDYHDDMDMFMEALIDGLENTSLTIVGTEQIDDELDGDLITKALVEANYINDEGNMGTRLAELLSVRMEAYAPPLWEDGIDRRFNYAKTKTSPLFREFIHALEDSPFTVDTKQLEIEVNIAGIIGEEKVKAFYALVGAAKLDPYKAYISEFKGDTRGRGYQASCHGPNGQASDMERSLMDLHGVDMGYDPKEALQHLKEEMVDMVATDDKLERLKLYRAAVANPEEFIMEHDTIKDNPLLKTQCGKAHSFTKACRIIKQLSRHINKGGDKPYIGMAFGLDAKCSGPQIGALMVGDQDLAAACGFSKKRVSDAYHRAIASLAESGFHNLERNDIKKPFMGIFYGQGVGAYMDSTNEDIQGAVWDSMYGGEFESMSSKEVESIAEKFHAAIIASFGAKMVMVRNAFKSYTNKIYGKVRHTMPDGFEVAMNYKQKVNAKGNLMEYGTKQYDIRLTNNAETYKFINFQMNTQHVHTGDFVRNGFVNMIQATDALLARLIVVHAKRLGIKHIIAIHDCFRTSVNEIGILKEAIKRAYQDLFGTVKDVCTEDMPYGLDILGLYFQGINKQLLPEHEGTKVSQFFNSGTRRIQKIKGDKLTDLIWSLGTTYYFDK